MTGPSRRDVLRKTAAATAAGLAAGAFAGTATAAHAAPVDVDGVGADEVRASLGTTGGDVLASLAADGVLREPSASVLPVDERVGIGAVAANREGTATVRGSDGVLRYVTVAHLDDGVLTVTAEPDRDRSYAHFQPDGSDARLRYDPDAGQVGVESGIGTQASCSCLGVTCGDGRPLEECEECYMGSECPPPDYLCCDTWYDCC